MLATFVAPEDYNHLIDILKRIYDGTLRDTVSILLISGPYSSGKTTLMNIMQRLNVGAKFPTNGYLNQIHHVAFGESIVYGSEFQDGDIVKCITDLHTAICGEMYARRLYQDALHIEKPGALVMSTCEALDLVLRKRKRKIIQLELPFNFKTDPNIDVVEICVEEFLTIIADEAEVEIKVNS